MMTWRQILRREKKMKKRERVWWSITAACAWYAIKARRLSRADTRSAECAPGRFGPPGGIALSATI